MLQSLNLPTLRIRTELEDISVVNQNEHVYHLFHRTA